MPLEYLKDKPLNKIVEYYSTKPTVFKIEFVFITGVHFDVNISQPMIDDNLFIFDVFYMFCLDDFLKQDESDIKEQGDRTDFIFYYLEQQYGRFDLRLQNFDITNPIHEIHTLVNIKPVPNYLYDVRGYAITLDRIYPNDLYDVMNNNLAHEENFLKSTDGKRIITDSIINEYGRSIKFMRRPRYEYEHYTDSSFYRDYSVAQKHKLAWMLYVEMRKRSFNLSPILPFRYPFSLISKRDSRIEYDFYNNLNPSMVRLHRMEYGDNGLSAPWNTYFVEYENLLLAKWNKIIDEVISSNYKKNYNTSSFGRKIMDIEQFVQKYTSFGKSKKKAVKKYMKALRMLQK